VDSDVTVSGYLTLSGEGEVGVAETATLTFADGSTYEHARDGGDVPSATWDVGSTALFSGLVADGPSNASQNYHHVVWNNPGQASNLSLGLGTVTISGNVRVVDSGGSRFRLTTDGDGNGQTITIEGDVLVEGGAIETTGSSGTAEYNVVVNGDVMIYNGTTFATSRGSGGKATWTLGGDFVVMADATLRDSHEGYSSRVVFAGSTTQNISISADAEYNGAFNFTVSGSDVVVPADSMFHFEDDFLVDGALTVNGTISARDTLKVDGGTLTVAAGGTYNHDYDAGEIPTATWADGSTVWLTGIETSDPDNGDQDFFNYTWDNAGQGGNINIGWDDYTLRGNLTVLNTNGNQFRLTSADTENPRVITIMGDVVVDGETAEFTATGSGDIADYDITVMGDISVLNGGFLSASRGSGGRAVWTLYGDMTINAGEIGDSDTDKHGQFRTFVFAADTASDGVPGQTLTMNDVSYDSDVYFEVADSSGILLAAGSDWTYEGIFTNYGVFDVDGDATLTFADGATYDHARDGGDVPTAVWAEGSTALFTGMSTSGPGNANQDFYNLVIDAPNNASNNDFGMQDNTIYGDVNVVNTGSARAYFTGPSPYDTLEITVMGDINMQQGAFSSNGTGSAFTEITIHHHGDINVTDGNFSISRGSGPIVYWYMYEGDFNMAAGKTQNSNARSESAFIFAGEEVVQHMNVSADVDMSNLPVRVDSGAYLDVGTTSFQPNGDNFTLNAGGTLAVADTAGFDANFELAGSSETELSLSTEGHYVLNGTEHQNTGFRLPATVASLTIDNGAGVTQSRPIIVNDFLRLANGILDNTPGITLGEEAEVIVENGRTLLPMEGVPNPPSNDEIVWTFDNPEDLNGWVNGTNSSQTLAGNADATQGDSSMSWTYTVDPSEDWGGSADIQLMFGDYLTDLSDYDGFSFDYKTLSPADPTDGGASLNVKVYVESTGGVEQYHYTVPNVLSDTTGEWQTANVFFEDMAIPSWLDTFDGVLYPDMITHIEMQVIVGSDGSETSGQVLLDNAVPATAPLPIPEPPYAIGDIVNYNGSFASAELGSGEAEGWLIEGTAGSSWEIVDDAADDDERALMFNVSHEGENWYASQAVNEPINVVEGERYRASVHMKADEAGRLVQFYVGMDDRGGWARVRGWETPQLDLTTEWAEYAFEFDATAAHETNQLRMAVEFNVADNDGGTIYFDNAVMEKIEATSNENLEEIPNELALNQNYPNPFNPTTKISYALPEASDVSIKIYDITGREVAELVNARKSAGTHEITWNAQQFATGVYLYRIQAGDFTAVRKLTLIK
jgi:hypothetical protein